jgi:YggT family protein
MGLIRNIAIASVRVYEIMLFLRALLSWFPMSDNYVMSFLYNITEPLLEPIRKLLHKIPALQNIPIDFSIIVLLLLLDVFRMLIITL